MAIADVVSHATSDIVNIVYVRVVEFVDKMYARERTYCAVGVDHVGCDVKSAELRATIGGGSVDTEKRNGSVHDCVVIRGWLRI